MQDKTNMLRLKVGPLLRFASDVDVAAETFSNKVERLKLQRLRGQPAAPRRLLAKQIGGLMALRQII